MEFERMHEQIIALLGPNHTTPIQFDKPHIEVYGLYTYKGGVYCFKEGMDVAFSNLTNKEKNDTFQLIKDKKYKLNPSLQ